MITFKVNNSGNMSKVVENGRVEQYLDALKSSDPKQVEWAADWFLKAVELGESEYLESPSSFANSRHGGYIVPRNDMEKAIVTEVEIGSLGFSSINGIPEDVIFDPYSEEAMEAVEDKMTRVEVLKDWLRLENAVAMEDGKSFIKLVQMVINDKAKSCCGTVAKQLVVNYDSGSHYMMKFTNDSQLKKWKKDMERVNAEVYPCRCKGYRAKRMSVLRDILDRYQAEGLFEKVLSDKVIAPYAVWNQDLFDLEKELDGWEMDSDSDTLQEQGFGGIDYLKKFF